MCGRNATYLSWKMQNEIITASNKLMQQALVEHVNNAGFFAVLADATTDSATVEQLSILIRFVEKQ
ncbi:UNVERIFIED_CONTAM: hypothetical protein FKN15_061760 [Acipenser sinensis]